MKNEFITLSPAGAIALFVAGALGSIAVIQHDLGCAAVAVLCLAVARENGREPFESGTYDRGWFMWRRTGPAVDAAKNNIVPFKGPAA